MLLQVCYVYIYKYIYHFNCREESKDMFYHAYNAYMVKLIQILFLIDIFDKFLV